MFHVKHSTSPPPLENVSRETLLRLELFADLLLTWNARINLISRADAPHLWQRHITDALQLAPLIPPGCPRAIDLGSGAGFPGLILAIAYGIEVDLIEQDQRKAAFLREAAMVTRAPVHIHATKIERAKVAPAPLVVSRALATLPILLGWAHPLLTEDGICLFPKSSTAESEITQAERRWSMHIDRLPSRTDPNGVILRIRDLRPKA